MTEAQLFKLALKIADAAAITDVRSFAGPLDKGWYDVGIYARSGEGYRAEARDLLQAVRYLKERGLLISRGKWEVKPLGRDQ